MGLPKYSVSERLRTSVVWLVIFLLGVRVLCKLSFFVFSCKKDFVSVVSGFVVVTVGLKLISLTWRVCLRSFSSVLTHSGKKMRFSAGF